jgi:hypothetical protein
VPFLSAAARCSVPVVSLAGRLSLSGTPLQGNWNNVLEVAPPPRIETPEQQAHFAALQAMWSAFERKCHFVRNGHSV